MKQYETNGKIGLLLLLLFVMIAAVSCTKKNECSKVVKVEQALVPFAPGTFKVITDRNDTLLTTVPYKVGQIICK